jgi:molybdopterin-guanine dinucleotide biosynthesis protein A
MHEEFGGVVLCGGGSRRLGFAKEWLRIHGETLLARTVRVVSQAVSPVVVVAAPEGEVPPLPESPWIRVLRDATPRPGPLAGLLTGLAAMEADRRGAFVAACDLPQLRESFVRGMIARLGGWEIAVPRVGGALHPLAAVYGVEVLPSGARLLQTRPGAGPKHLCLESRTRYVERVEVETFDPECASLADVDTWSDWLRS